MAITLPLPVRIAAGVLATGLDRLRHLPQDLPALSVTVAGQAVRASMRVQQEVAELAGRGDELLSGIISRPTEHPAWARFDDEEGDGQAPTGRTVDGTVATNGSAPGDPVTDADPTDPVTAEPAEPVTDSASSADPVTDADPTDPVTDSTPAGPPDMPGYDDLRLTQVRARLRRLDAAAVGRLLAYEQGGPARAPFVTLLTNRLTTLESGASRDHQA